MSFKVLIILLFSLFNSACFALREQLKEDYGKEQACLRQLHLSDPLTQDF